MLIKTFAFLCLASCTGHQLYSQAAPTATRTGDLQVGGTFNLASPDYSPHMFKGFGAYTTFDFKYHFGVEAEFHQLNDPNSTEGLYERTYEIGPRYVLHFNRFSPYAKFMLGRGVFNFPPAASNPTGGAEANLAYNMLAGGIGTDYRLRPSINLRVDFESQHWGGFPPHGLTPNILSFGVAYHFH